MSRRRLIALCVALAAGLLLLVVGTVYAVNRGQLDPNEVARLNADAAAHDRTVASQAAATREAARPRVVAFLGDSYTGGSDNDSGEAYRWPALVSKDLRWEPRYFAVGGSGYINPGQGKPFSDRVTGVINLHPDIVIVAGGLNDAQTYPTADLGKAALDVLQRLRAGLPAADIVVVGNFFPRWPVDDARVAAARDVLHAAQQAVPSTKWIDPLPWFTNGAVEIGRGGTHPTDAGHKTIAVDMEAALRQLGYGAAVQVTR